MTNHSLILYKKACRLTENTPKKNETQTNLLVRRLEITRTLGGNYLGFGDGIKVWAKERQPEKKAPDFTKFEGWDLGDEKQFSSNEQLLLKALDLTKNAEGRYTHTRETLQLLTEQAKSKVPPFFELTAENVTSEDLERVIVGYGDPWNNGWYGAGPTRNPLRATYAVRLFTLLPELEIFRRTMGMQKIGEALPILEAGITKWGFSKYQDSGYSYTYGSGLQPMGKYVAEKEDGNVWLNVYLANAGLKKDGLTTNRMMGDVVLSMTTGTKSGHAFIPPEARHESPLYGSLEIILGDEVKGVHAKATVWALETMEKLRGVVVAVLPPNFGSHTTDAITVNNT